MIIPKYQGYVPNLKANSLLQKRQTEQSRDVFKASNIDDKTQTMASTGFNPMHIPKHDDTLHSTSRRYGTETKPTTHPAVQVASHYATNETTFRASFINPKRHPSQVYRTRNPDADMSTETNVKIESHVTDKTNLNGPRQVLINNCSGYVMNSTLWDSTSWATEKNFHTDQQRTQYRK